VNNGIYTAYSGMKAQMDALEVVSNNLSNVNSAGFKGDMAFYSALNEELNGSQENKGAGNVTNNSIKTESVVDFSNGVIQTTDRNLDIAIEGDGFLTVETPHGIRYTRNGNMHLEKGSILANSDGYPIAGINGNPITVGPGTVHINKQGDVFLNGGYVDRLKVVSIEDRNKLAKEGHSLLAYRSDKEPKILENTCIRSGCLEQSNVSAVSAIVQMVNIMRQFESIQKCVNLEMNEMNSKAIEKLGR
jgi:flagellar basal-body rod protein FlgF